MTQIVLELNFIPLFHKTQCILVETNSRQSDVSCFQKSSGSGDFQYFQQNLFFPDITGENQWHQNHKLFNSTNNLW